MRTQDNETSPAELRRQRRALARWLREWELDQILRREDPPEGTGPTPSVPPEPGIARCAEGARRDSAPPRVGEIRLLYPLHRSPTARRMIYVVILRAEPDGAFLVAPVSRFSEPAVPGEWRTGSKALPVRVLCLWNARVVSRSILGMSWRAGRLRPAGITRAMAAIEHLRSGVALSKVRPGDTGPPVRHPSDPRLIYLAEEAAAFD